MDKICTIIALNYLPQVMALLESTRKIYPDIPFFVLIIDSDTKDIPALASSIVLLPSDLDMPPLWIEQMKMYYDTMELATSLKPFLLKTLLTDGISTVTFLDPDILLFDELTEAFNSARDFGIALTPHRLTPASSLDAGLDEIAFLKYGIFNLGFISVGHSSKPMLLWWCERLRWYCTKFPNDPVFTDQKWMDFVPAFFKHKVIYNPGYNLAPWNIDERPLSLQNGSYFAGDKKLVFIHFSQMSGALAAGKLTNSWKNQKNLIDRANESLELINSITREYSNKLVENGNKVIKIQLAHGSNIKVSYHQKKRLISKIKHADFSNSFQNQNVLNEKNTMKIWSKVTCALEKSSALNGFRDGLKLDTKKFIKLLRQRTR
jgi:hypothetical protein